MPVDIFTRVRDFTRVKCFYMCKYFGQTSLFLPTPTKDVNLVSYIFLQMLSSPNSNSTFITNIMDISYEKKINFMDVLVSRKTPLISDNHKTANNNEAQQLIRCLNTWCNPNSRKQFAEIMEGRVVRTAPSE